MTTTDKVLIGIGTWILLNILIAVAWKFLFRHRRRHHISRRGHP